MKLTRLELSGFKSFADDINLPFEEGVTAIVGPNGCGKSNVSDAVRWVLGEQRARMLRGSKMDEVIFQGSAGRKPTNIAEVSLYFDNSDGVLPISYNEVVVTRRLSRSGQSDYLINNSPVRLRDVQDLLRGTGLGADAGVVIEARMIDRLLSDRAEERRSLFEEAAGIGLYRDRRNSTERRLERTREDLQRLDDLISEVQTQVRSLARQKGKAERHRRFTAERFQIVMTLARHDLEALDRQNRELKAQLEARNEEIPRLQRRLAETGQERENRIQERASAEAKRGELDRRLADLRVELEKIEGDLNLGEERLRNTEARKTRAMAEIEEARERAQHAHREHEAATREKDNALQDLESVQTELDLRTNTEGENRQKVNERREIVRQIGESLQEKAEQIRSLSGERNAIEAELGDLENEHSSAELRLRDAEEARRAASEQIEAARTANATASDRHERSVAQLERAKHELAAAREAETAVQVEFRSLEQESAQLSARQEALEELERNRVGLAPAARKLLDATADFPEGTILGPLSDFIDPAPGQAIAAERVLSRWIHAVLVSDTAAVERIGEWHHREAPGTLVLLPVHPGPRDVRPGNGFSVGAKGPAEAWVNALAAGVALGDETANVITDATGAVFLNQSSDSAGPLGRREELDRQRERLSEINSRLESVRRQSAEARKRLQECQAEVETSATRADADRTAHREAASELEVAERSLEATNREFGSASENLTRLEERTASRNNRLVEVGRLHESAVSERKKLELEMETQKALLEESVRAQEDAQEKRVHWQVEEAQVAARQKAAAERQQRSHTEASEYEKRILELERELLTIEQQQSELREAQTRWSEGIGERKTAIAEIESAVARASADVEKAVAAVQAKEQEIQGTRETSRQVTETTHRIELELTELAGRKTAMVERIEAEWDRPLDEMIAEAERADGDMDAMRQEAQKLKETIEAMGPVNPLAVEEHEQEVERLEFLTSQRDDLVEARDGLITALKEMDATARTMFLEAFSDIRENYLTVFNTLFEGGTCDLKLAEPDDPLNSDIDIHAAPRGKRTQRIHLLSSGERALVAISLLFAIYLTKPSPFCLLDEVDAPLDDSNVLRFVRLLDEFKDETQFIVITHNPRTMQVADSVYGVTMQEPGVSKIVGVRLGEVEAVTA